MYIQSYRKWLLANIITEQLYTELCVYEKRSWSFNLTNNICANDKKKERQLSFSTQEK